MLEINLSLVILTAIVFLGLIVILNPLLYKPMLKFIDDRNTSIKNDEDSVSQTANDLSAYEQEIESILSGARNEASVIKQEALNVAKEASLKEITSKRVALEKEYESFLSSLNEQKSDLKSNLLLKLPELKTVLSEKLVKI